MQHWSSRNNEGQSWLQIVARGYPLLRRRVQLALYDFIRHGHLAHPRVGQIAGWCSRDLVICHLFHIDTHAILLPCQLFCLKSRMAYFWRKVTEVTCFQFLYLCILDFLQKWLDLTDCGTFVTSVPDICYICTIYRGRGRNASQQFGNNWRFSPQCTF